MTEEKQYLLALDCFELRELSALRFALYEEREAILNMRRVNINPCFLANARDMLTICLRELDEYAEKKGYVIKGNIYDLY